jgi:hypothetical protein
MLGYVASSEIHSLVRKAGLRAYGEHLAEIQALICTASAHRRHYFEQQRSSAKELMQMARKPCAVCESPVIERAAPARMILRVCAYFVGGESAAFLAVLAGMGKLRRDASRQRRSLHFTVAQYVKGPLAQLEDDWNFREAVGIGIDDILQGEESVKYPQWVLDACWMLFTNVHSAAVPCTWMHLVED